MAARSSSVLPGKRYFRASTESTPSSCKLRTTMLLLRISSLLSSKTSPSQRQATFVLPSGIRPVTPGGISPVSSVARMASSRFCVNFCISAMLFSCAFWNSSGSSKSSIKGGTGLTRPIAAANESLKRFSSVWIIILNSLHKP